MVRKADERLIRSLDQAVVETFGLMCFADVLVGATESNSFQPVQTVVAFTGDDSGCVEMRMAKSTARELASSFLGVEPAALPCEHIDSVCRELTNMICGAMVSLARPDGHFDLQSPVLREYPAEPLRRSIARLYSVNAASIEIGVDCENLAAVPVN